MNRIKKWLDIWLKGRDQGEGQQSFVQERRGPLVLWRFAAAPAGARVYFTTRSGGVSAEPYHHLNLGFHVADRPASVLKNRELLLGAFGFAAPSVTSPRQRHSAIVAVLDEGGAGSGAASEESAFDPCDGLATSLKNAPMLLHFADCAPVVLTGRQRGGEPAVAVLHAGRQGLAAGVIGQGVALMERKFGVQPSGLTAAVGPAIGACCYEVSEEIAEPFEKRFGADVVVRGRTSCWLDMQSAAEAALIQAGIPEEGVHVLEICTSCDPDFYSYRRDGVTGRHGALAWIE